MSLENPMTLAGKRILITGASSGIGRASAILASHLGAEVVLVARRSEALKITQQHMKPGTHLTICFDLAQVEKIPDWLKQLVQQTGPLDGLVHAAGLHAIRPLRMLSIDLVRALMLVNVEAGLALIKGFRQKNVLGPHGGSVVLLASISGVIGQAGLSAYSATKGAVIAVTKSLAVELASEKIRVNCVVPAVVNTPMTEHVQTMISAEQFKVIEAQHPLGLGEPMDVAHAILFLISGAARWITGTSLIVDGGYTAQ